MRSPKAVLLLLIIILTLASLGVIGFTISSAVVHPSADDKADDDEAAAKAHSRRTLAVLKDGIPLANAEVSITGVGEHGGQTVITTDANGKASVPHAAKAQECFVVISKGRMQTNLLLRIPSRGEVMVDLHADGTLAKVTQIKVGARGSIQESVSYESVPVVPVPPEN